MKPIHAGRLERFLGAEKIASLQEDMRGWYGSPIGLIDVPGAVYVTSDGDFVGKFREGGELTQLDRLEMGFKRMRKAFVNAAHRSRNQANMAISSVDDLLAALGGGKRYDSNFSKTGSALSFTFSQSMWPVGDMPAAGSNASAAPGGRACTKTTSGAMAGLPDADTGEQSYLVSAGMQASWQSSNLLLYDRLFDVAKTMSSTSTESVTGVPTRYQSTTLGDPDYAANTFIFPEVVSTLSSTAHNWTVVYTDQDGNTGASTTWAGRSSGTNTGAIDLPSKPWFAPLATGDTGVKAVTSMTLSASVTGTMQLVMAHPLGWATASLSSQFLVMDYVLTAFQITRVFDGACLALIEPTRGLSSSIVYTGVFSFVQG